MLKHASEYELLCILSAVQRQVGANLPVPTFFCWTQTPSWVVMVSRPGDIPGKIGLILPLFCSCVHTSNFLQLYKCRNIGACIRMGFRHISWLKTQFDSNIVHLKHFYPGIFIQNDCTLDQKHYLMLIQVVKGLRIRSSESPVIEMLVQQESTYKDYLFIYLNKCLVTRKVFSLRVKTASVTWVPVMMHVFLVLREMLGQVEPC